MMRMSCNGFAFVFKEECERCPSSWSDISSTRKQMMEKPLYILQSVYLPEGCVPSHTDSERMQHQDLLTYVIFQLLSSLKQYTRLRCSFLPIIGYISFLPRNLGVPWGIHEWSSKERKSIKLSSWKLNDVFRTVEFCIYERTFNYCYICMKAL